MAKEHLLATQSDTESELARRARFQEQCFLLYNRYAIKQQLITKTRDFLILNDKKKPKTGSQRALSYDHIVMLDSNNPETLASQINAIDGADVFFGLDATILSQLKPIVELYKIYPHKNITSKAGVKTPVRIPFLLGEGISTEETRDARDHFLGESGLSAIGELFRSHGSLGNVMPHDFNIKFAGKDIAWVNAIDRFSFSLSFSSFKLFNHEFQTPDPLDASADYLKWSYTDLISTSNKFLVDPKDVAPKINSVDALNASECSYQWNDAKIPGAEPKSVGESTNSQHFEIQAIIRYDDSAIDWEMAGGSAYDPKIRWDVQKRWDDAEKEKLKNFLRSSALVVRLQFKQHTIRYNVGASGGSDAEFILDLDYAAYLEGVLSSPELDLLKLNNAHEHSLSMLERDLAYTKRLLAEVRGNNLTLDQAVGGMPKGKGSTDSNSAIVAYSSFRRKLTEKMGTPDNPIYGTWLIKLPINRSGARVPYDQIIPDVNRERIKAAANPKRQPRWHNRGNRLKRTLNPKEGQLAPGQTETDFRLAVKKQNAVAVFEELVQEYKAFLARQRRAFQHERYRQFFAMLLTRGRLYKIKAVREALGMNSFATKGDLVVSKERGEAPSPAAGEQWAGKGAEVVRPLEVPPHGNIGKKIDEFQEQTVNAINKAEIGTAGINKALPALLKSKKEGTLQLTTADKSGKLVYFTTFGDILDIAIDIATRDKVEADKIVGTFGPGLFDRRLGILIGPLVDEGSKTLQGKRKSTFNLAHTPISLSLLMGWWLKNVVARDRQTYTLGDFIRDLIKDLVVKMLGESCIEGSGDRRHGENIKILNFTSTAFKSKGGKLIPPFYPAFSRGAPSSMPVSQADAGTSNVQLVTSNGGLQLQDGWDFLSPKRIVPWMKHLKPQNAAGKITEVLPGTPLDEQFNYMLIYVHSYTPKNLDPYKEKENIRKGIYYLHLGQMSSIIQSCAFSRMEVPYWREMKIAGAMSRTGGQMLRDVYDANITLFGINAFKVGSLVFLDPTKDGAFEFREWKRLGIGGFYLITEVEHTLLQEGNVTQQTKLKLRYVTAGGCGEESDPQTQNAKIANEKGKTVTTNTGKARARSAAEGTPDVGQ